MKNKRIALDRIGELIPDGATVSISGAWMLVPDATLAAVGEAF